MTNTIKDIEEINLSDINKDLKIKEITEGDEKTGKEGYVVFNNDKKLTLSGFTKDFTEFLRHRIAGETITYADMERFMIHRTSGKSLELLMKNKKKEGFMEGSGDKTLSKGQKIAIGTVFVVAILLMVVFIVMKQQGLLNF